MLDRAFDDCLDERERRLFEREMSGVEPIAQRSNVRHHTPKAPSEAQLARRQHATAGNTDDNFLSDEFVELVAADEPLRYRRDGIQRGLLDKLAHGGYLVESQLNVQRRPLSDVRRELFGFIRDAQAHQLRSLLIIHGRGRRDDSHATIVRSYMAKWLAQFECVQAFCSAAPRLGGLGATQIVLSKSEAARHHTRERHLARRAR
ncbi:DNA endonuclease SmrA [Carnimonas bestiolae]|uniref:DNA endonuclease SmrA n=1 Tax=Carnimonas bestiolae TaxID=3402172 RepID=UPI003EDC7539